MLKYYFSLQCKRIYRLLQSTGIHPIIGGGVLLGLFIGVSYLLFQRIAYASYLYVLTAWSTANLLGEMHRNDFLKNTYSKANHQKIRLLENLILVTPFVCFLVYQQAYLESLILYFIGGMSAYFNQINRFRWVLPTPFYRFPFEFTRGFRQSYWVFGLCYALATISVNIGNFYMGAFSLILTLSTCWSFYAKPEPNFYVWIHAETPSSFLWKKIKIALFYTALISLPLLLALSLVFPEKAYVLLIFEAGGILYLIALLLGKYAYFPAEINISASVLLTISLFFPPFLIFLIPYLYFKSRKNLVEFL